MGGKGILGILGVFVVEAVVSKDRDGGLLGETLRCGISKAAESAFVVREVEGNQPLA